MKRRSFIQKTSSGLLGMGVTSQGGKIETRECDEKLSLQGYVTMDENRVNYYSSAVRQSLKIILATDTHLGMNDERGDPYRKYSDRMAKAYNQTSHFKTGEPTNPQESFRHVVQLAKESGADMLALPGDLFSWPSEAAIEWVQEILDDAGVPYIFVAGNHDWHYEGMEGSMEDLRATWIEKRLLPLYQGKNPLMAAYDIKGIRFVAIDNSTYQISDEQLAFFRAQVESGLPLVLLVHIPLYAPGRPVNYGCGHPEWGAAADSIFEIERRPRWPESGHTATTMNFYREVFSAPNLLGSFSGHIHRPSFEQVNGTPQFVADNNASGAFLDINLNPLSQDDKKLFSRLTESDKR
ncbi:MAG: metallophosphoesterase [Balneolales bacterium]